MTVFKDFKHKSGWIIDDSGFKALKIKNMEEMIVDIPSKLVSSTGSYTQANYTIVK